MSLKVTNFGNNRKSECDIYPNRAVFQLSRSRPSGQIVAFDRRVSFVYSLIFGYLYEYRHKSYI